MHPFDPLLAMLGEIPDPRRAEGNLYKLPCVLLFSILAVVTGGNSFRSIETFIKVHRGRLNAAFGLRWKRAPAHTAVRYILQGLDPQTVEQALMSTAISWAAIEIIRLYGLRFNFEHTFKQAMRLIGSFSYHFCMSDMKPTRRRKSNQHLHRASPEYRDAVRRKQHAYHVFIQPAVVCQSLLQYLAIVLSQRVWDALGSWLRTIRPGIPPSELVVANALRQSMPEFLLNSAPDNIFAKFVIERQDTDKMEAFRLGS